MKLIKLSKKISQEQINKIIVLVKENWGVREISEYVGVSNTSVRKILDYWWEEEKKRYISEGYVDIRSTWRGTYPERKYLRTNPTLKRRYLPKTVQQKEDENARDSINFQFKQLMNDLKYEDIKLHFNDWKSAVDKQIDERFNSSEVAENTKIDTYDMARIYLRGHFPRFKEKFVEDLQKGRDERLNMFLSFFERNEAMKKRQEVMNDVKLNFQEDIGGEKYSFNLRRRINIFNRDQQ